MLLIWVIYPKKAASGDKDDENSSDKVKKEPVDDNDSEVETNE